MTIQETLDDLDNLMDFALQEPWCESYTERAIRNLEQEGSVICPEHGEDVSRCNHMGKRHGILIAHLFNAYPALREEIKRLEREIESLKQTSFEIEQPNGKKGYVQVHCLEKHDHFVNPGTGLKLL